MSRAPVLLIIAGPNGAGKTTLTRQLQSTGVDLGEYINPDDIAAQLHGLYDERVRAAQRTADALREKCLDDGVSFSFETVMSHPSKVELLHKARSLGYFVVMYFVGTESPALNIARVRQRVALGGHDVPEDRINKRWYRTMDLLQFAVEQCDRVVLFDNSYRDSAFEPVAFVPFCELTRLPAESSQDRVQFTAVRVVQAATPEWAWKYLFWRASIGP